jgi:hypothetical protein
MRRLARLLAVLCGLWVVVGTASAHRLGQSRVTAPLPLPLVFLGAGATVGMTALWLGVAGSASTARSSRRVGTVPSTVASSLRTMGRVGFFALFVAALIHGAVGRQVASENLVTVFVWPVWLKGIGLLAIVFGSPWRTLSPWESLYDVLATIEGEALAVVGPVPGWVGTWPAVAGFVLGVGIVENLTVVGRSPRLTVLVVASYTLLMLVGAVLFGRDWFERADTLTVLYRLFGRVAPLRFEPTEAGGYHLHVRPPWRGCIAAVRAGSLVVFAVAAVYSVSFDGFTNTTEYQTVLFALREPLQTGPSTGVMLYLVGLLGFLCSYWLAVLAGQTLATGDRRGWRVAALAFAPTILPIAAAYELAHNVLFVGQNLGQGLAIVGSLLGGRADPISLLGWVSVPGYWGAQVVLIVGGHVVAVVAAHRVAVRRYQRPWAVRRGHLPLVLVMIGYTILSLWIISRPLVT